MASSARKYLVLAFAWLVTLAWLLMWMYRPTKYWSVKFWQPLMARVVCKAFSTTGAYYVAYILPVVLVALAAAFAYHSSQAIKIRKERFFGSFRHNPWTFPLLIRGPLSILSAAEFVFILLLIAYVVYYVAISSNVSFQAINHKKVHGSQLLHTKIEIVGTKLGLAGIPCFLLLFFPVTRGSAILQLLNLPFEHAVKFHIWIATIMLTTWTAHGLAYITAWAAEKQIHELWAWDPQEISGLSGLIALIFGLTIWITSLGPVRRRKFQLFYYTHHLYVMFLLFYALHVGDALYSVIVGAVLLFFGSRLLRFLQSQQKVDVISARMLSSDSMELTIAKQPDLYYNSASFVFLNIPALSAFQWHPFTVTSTSNIETDQLSLYIKCNGDWTSKLQKLIHDDGVLQLEAAVEGPYGHNMDYLSRYQVITFIAGGSGISPFISMLKDLLHSIQEKQMDPPKQILLIYIVKRSDQLRILESINPASICPDFAEGLKIDIQAYVTRENGPDPEQTAATYEKITFSGPGLIEMKRLPSSRSSAVFAEPSPNNLANYKFSRKVKAMTSALVAHNLVQATVLLASFGGYLILAALIGRYYIYPIVSNPHRTFSRSGKGFLAFSESLLGVLIFGGVTALVSRTFFKKSGDWTPQGSPMTGSKEVSSRLKPTQVHYGLRPNFRDIFSEQAKSAANCNVGILSSGPAGMQKDVAAFCQTHRITKDGATYNYHQLSFDF